MRPKTDIETGHRVVVARSLGVHLQGALEPHADPGDTRTLADGVDGRMGRPMPVPTVDFDEFLVEIAEFVLRWLKKSGLVPLSAFTDVSVEEWLGKTMYTLARKQELLKVVEENPNLFERDSKGRLKNFKVKLFMKDEHYLDFKHARGIYAREDNAKVVFGPWFKLIEEQVYSLPEFIKHVPVRDRPNFIMEKLYIPGGKYVATDYTAFENHFTAKLMQAVEFVLYTYMLQHVIGGEHILGIMKEVLCGKNIVQNRYLDCIIEARRMSGEMNTSLGNGFSNLMFMAFVCEKLGLNCNGVVEGDDGLFAFNGNTPSASDFTKYGFNIKLDVHSEISTASFCGNVFDPEDRQIMTCPYDVLSTFGWTTNKYAKSSDKTLKALLRSKSLSLAYQYPGCPILGSLAQYGLRVTKGYNVEKVVYSRNTSLWDRAQQLEALEYFKNTKYQNLYEEPKIGTRLLFEQLYGIPVSTQVMIERELDSLNKIQPLNFPLISDFCPKSWSLYYDLYTMEVEPAFAVEFGMQYKVQV